MIVATLTDEDIQLLHRNVDRIFLNLKFKKHAFQKAVESFLAPYSLLVIIYYLLAQLVKICVFNFINKFSTVIVS